MAMMPAPNLVDVVLIGGGHSHALLIRAWAMKPMAGVRLTLISRDVLTPYSGMLPGLVAGHYTSDEVHIDLARLCSWGGVRFIEATMTAIDLSAREITLDDERPPLGFDVLSLDTGSTPDLSVPGAAEHSIPVKPVHEFQQRWNAWRSQRDGETRQLTLGVVGSGAGGFELVTAMQHTLGKDTCQCHWFIRGQRPLGDRPERVSALALQAARDLGIEIHDGFDVERVTANGLQSRDGRAVELDDVLWCTAAAAPSWVAAAGLATDARGFVATNAHLQSVSHPWVFATGDIGTQVSTPSGKAGVFAVRQAPFLLQNIQRYLKNQALKTYAPQRDFLSLMATGPRNAIASRNGLAIRGDWVWRWKDHIDQTFMQRFRQLPELTMAPPSADEATALVHNPQLDVAGSALDQMPCAGCGAKVGAGILERVLSQLPIVPSADVLKGVSDAGDVAILESDGRPWVQSLDSLRSFIDDPYRFGEITALHALSDVVTERASAQSAQVLITMPFASDALTYRDLRQLMAGSVAALNREACPIVGGHTSEGAELSLGFVVNARLSHDSPVSGSTAATGDVLVLTQPIGIGTLLAGSMQTLANGVDVRSAYGHMRQSNAPAARLLHDAGAYAVTDVTGFGLLEHCRRLLRDQTVRASIDVSRVPVLDGALELAEAGVRSTLWRHNRHALRAFSVQQGISEAWQSLLCDPQTGGGLLAIVPAAAAGVVHTLRADGYLLASVIGELGPAEPTGSGVPIADDLHHLRQQAS